MEITYDNLLDIVAEAYHRLHSALKNAYKTGFLEEYLSEIGMADLYPVEGTPLYDTYPNGKILIVGDSRVKEQEICGIMKELGIDKDRLELMLDYNKAKSYPFRNLQYNPAYRLILFGPVPHSGEGKQDKSSIITQIENDDGYPKVIRINDAHGMKITKSSVRGALSLEIESGYLAV